MQTHYPWLRNLGAKDIARVFVDYFENPPRITYTSEGIEIHLPEESTLPRYFFVKMGRDVSISGGKVVYDMKNFKVVEMDDYEMTIRDKR